MTTLKQNPKDTQVKHAAINKYSPAASISAAISLFSFGFVESGEPVPRDFSLDEISQYVGGEADWSTNSIILDSVSVPMVSTGWVDARNQHSHFQQWVTLIA